MRPAIIPDIEGHDLYYVEDYPALDAAPFFVGSHFMKVDFETIEGKKWHCSSGGKESKFWQRVREDVKARGVINPINIDRMKWNGVLMDVCRHGGTRLWAARLYKMNVPVLMDVKAGEPPEGGIPVRDPLQLYEGEHYIEIVNGLFRVKAADIEAF